MSCRWRIRRRASRAAAGFIEIAKLYHGGGCNDAPGALVNLVRTASQGELKLQVRAAPEMIGIGDANLFRYPLLFMHGRRDFRFTPAERTRLAEYLERGGTLLADAICASKPFATAFRRELAAALPESSDRADPARRSALHDGLRRLRHPAGDAPRSGVGRRGATDRAPARGRSSRNSKASTSTTAGR